MSTTAGSGGDSSEDGRNNDGVGVALVENLSVPATSSGDSSAGASPLKKTPQDFIFGKMVGEGSYSSVYLAKDVKTGKEYAIKVCDKQHIIREKKSESIRREKEIMTILSANREPTAPFFVHLYATFQDPHRLYFVMTFAYGGELLKQLTKRRTFSKSLAQFYGGEIVQALKHMHKLKICHRDLKPENILLNENGHILVTDFGSGKKLTAIPTVATQEPTTKTPDQPSSGRTRSNSFVGTAQYVTPEILQGRYGDVGPAVDLWALGCIIFQFLSGHTPFQAQSEFLIFRKILKLEYEFPEGFDEDAKDLITKLLQIQFTDRLGARDSEYYTSIQEHPFFSGIDFENLHKMDNPLEKEENDSKDEKSSSATPFKQPLTIPDDYTPGYDPRVIAERFLRSGDSDENLSWEIPRHPSESSSESTQSEPVTPSTTDPKLLNNENIDSELNATTEIMNNMNIEQRCNSDCIGTPRRYSIGKTVFPADANERNSLLEKQAETNASWHKTAKGNLILKQGLVTKKKGLFSRKRMLLLTEGPHLLYCDPNSMSIKGEIPWSPSLKAEAKDFRIFYIHTPQRTYYLEDPDSFAVVWCDAINAMSQQTYGNKKNAAA